MPQMSSGRPDSTEYASYYEKYIAQVGGEDIAEALSQQLDTALLVLNGLSDDQADIRYASGKWSLKEVVGHVLDFERIFGYRALLVARGSQVTLPGCDQDELMRGADFGVYGIRDLVAEWAHVRRANISLFNHFPLEVWHRRGMAAGNPVSVRGIAYILAGHEAHHLRIIGEKYL